MSELRHTVAASNLHQMVRSYMPWTLLCPETLQKSLTFRDQATSVHPGKKSGTRGSGMTSSRE